MKVLSVILLFTYYFSNCFAQNNANPCGCLLKRVRTLAENIKEQEQENDDWIDCSIKVVPVEPWPNQELHVTCLVARNCITTHTQIKHFNDKIQLPPLASCLDETTHIVRVSNTFSQGNSVQTTVEAGVGFEFKGIGASTSVSVTSEFHQEQSTTNEDAFEYRRSVQYFGPFTGILACSNIVQECEKDVYKATVPENNETGKCFNEEKSTLDKIKCMNNKGFVNFLKVGTENTTVPVSDPNRKLFKLCDYVVPETRCNIEQDCVFRSKNTANRIVVGRGPGSHASKQFLLNSRAVEHCSFD
jgi:hypothetical protein